jgi:hypothetical protein
MPELETVLELGKNAFISDTCIYGMYKIAGDM